MTTAANTTLATLSAVSRFGFLDFRREREVAAGFVSRLGIKTGFARNARGQPLGGKSAEGGAGSLAGRKAGLAHS